MLTWSDIISFTKILRKQWVRWCFYGGSDITVLDVVKKLILQIGC